MARTQAAGGRSRAHSSLRPARRIPPARPRLLARRRVQVRQVESAPARVCCSNVAKHVTAALEALEGAIRRGLRPSSASCSRRPRSLQAGRGSTGARGRRTVACALARCGWGGAGGGARVGVPAGTAGGDIAVRGGEGWCTFQTRLEGIDAQAASLCFHGERT